jgi:hypothetical protein
MVVCGRSASHRGGFLKRFVCILRCEWGQGLMGVSGQGVGGGGVPLSLRVVFEPDAELDAEAGDRLARRLRAELSEHDGVESVVREPDTDLPEGAKAGDAVAIGAIMVALSASGGVLTGLVDTLREWLSRSSGRHRVSLTIDGDTIEIERAGGDQQRELLDAFIRRHSGE